MKIEACEPLINGLAVAGAKQAKKKKPGKKKRTRPTREHMDRVREEIATAPGHRAEVATRFGVSVTTVDRIRAKYKKHPPAKIGIAAPG